MAKVKCNMGFSKVACLKVRVTKKDIMEGSSGDPQECAIAQAVRRATGATLPVRVGDVIDVGDVSFSITKAIKKFIAMWDDTDNLDDERAKKKARRKFKPFTVELHEVIQ